MNQTLNGSGRLLALSIAAILAFGPVLAEKPEDKGKGKGKGYERSDSSEHRQDPSRDDDRGHRERVRLTPREDVQFVDQHRVYVRDYLALSIAAILAVGPVLAEKPEDKGKGKGYERSDRSEYRRDPSRDDDRGHRERVRLTPREGVHFVDQHRVYVRDYHAHEYRRGFCPPGLAKKNNGCMPPGHAKRWQIGRPLERDTIYYDLPPQLVVQIGLPPAGYRYVRVAADILLIAVGTGLVIDAIQDLGRL